MTLLGAGGAAKSILAQAILDGVSQISVFVRSVSMEKTRPYLTKLQEQTGFKVDLYALEDVPELQARIAESDLLVNATSLGMDGQSSPVPENIVLPETLLVADIIYQPFETPFLKWAEVREIKQSMVWECCSIKLQKLFNCGQERKCRQKRFGSP